MAPAWRQIGALVITVGTQLRHYEVVFGRIYRQFALVSDQLPDGVFEVLIYVVARPEWVVAVEQRQVFRLREVPSKSPGLLAIVERLDEVEKHALLVARGNVPIAVVADGVDLDAVGF